MAELDLGQVVMDNYNDLKNKPRINGKELSGNMSLEELGFQGGGSGGTTNYEDLENKPQIGGVELSGDKSPDELGLVGKTDFEEFSNQTTEAVENLETGLERTTAKVDIIIEKADLGIKETASGENIHLDDSADGKVVDFALYGKATQDGTPTPENPVDIVVAGESYNLLENTATSQTKGGVIFTVNENKSVTCNGTGQGTVVLDIKIDIPLENGQKYILTGCPNGGSISNYELRIRKTDGTALANDFGSGVEYIHAGDIVDCILVIRNGVIVDNLTFYPMIRKASVKNDRYMPYGKGSVEVKSVGKNLLPNMASRQTIAGITWTVNKDGSVSANGTTTTTPVSIAMIQNPTMLEEGKKYIVSGTPNVANCFIKLTNEDGGTSYLECPAGSSVEFTYDGRNLYAIECLIRGVGTKVENVVFYPMIRLASDTDSTYEPYKETISIIPTEGLAGIPVDSGGNYTDSNGQQWICDEIVKYADGSGEYVKRVEKLSLAISDMDNGENFPGWNAAVSGLSEIIGANVNDAARVFLLNIGKVIRYNTINRNTLYFTKDDYNMTQTEWKTNYPNLVAQFCLKRKELIRTPLTAEQIAEIEKLYTFYPVTHISNDFDAEMRVKYKADAKSYIDKRLELLTTAIINSI